MISLILKDKIEKSKIEALLYLLKSWNIDAELNMNAAPKTGKKANFSLAAGLWEDYEIDANELRKEAWNRK